jgi:hypothetical protein
MRTCLSLLTHLFALCSMCYLPEWNIVNNNNKYTRNINGDIIRMLTGLCPKCVFDQKYFCHTTSSLGKGQTPPVFHNPGSTQVNGLSAQLC